MDKTRKRTWILGSLFLLVSLMFFYSFIYNDILETMRVGISLWNDLFSGNIRHLYAGRWEMTPVAYTKEVQAVYDFPIYIVFALWNFPLWIAETFFKVDVFNSVLCLMWGKTLLLVATVLITWAIYRLCLTLELSKEISEFVCILFITSNFFMTSVIMMSAYDIVALYFVIEGMNFYFKGDRRGFLICFMCAIPLKFFALLLFIPLVLLIEKRILRIIGYGIMSILPILVFRLLVPCQAMAGEALPFCFLDMFRSTDLSNLAFLYTVTYEEALVLGRIYPSFIAWIILFLVCYFLKPEGKEGINKWGIYLCFLSYAILFTTCMSHPYWLLIMVPISAILMGQNYKYLYVNMILEMVYTWGMILAQIFKFPWCFGSGIVAGMFWPEILGEQAVYNPITPVKVFAHVTGSDGAHGYLVGAGGSVFVAGIVMFAVLNFPGIKRELSLIGKNERPAGWLMGLRVLSGFVIAMIPIALHMAGIYLERR